MKKLVVCGSTGTQGGSLIEVMKDLEGWEIFGFTRDMKSEQAKALISQGITMGEADLEDYGSLVKVIEGADCVFGITQPWNKSYTKVNTDAELKQGVNIVDACKAAGVKHLVLSTAAHLTDEKVGLPHVDVKIDIGESARIAFENPDEYISQHIKLIGDFISGDKLAETMGIIRDEDFRYTAVPKWLIWIMSREFYVMRVAFEELARDEIADLIPPEIEKCKKIYPGLMSMESYLVSKGWDKKPL